MIFKTQYKKSLTLPNKETKVDVEKKNVDSNHIVISIGRQFGAGGRQIGKLIADHYGIKYYDSELLVEAAKDMGFAPEIFAKADEVPSLQNSLDRLADLSSPNTSESVLSGANLFKAQSETMQRIADSESCVIVGRASDYVLRDRKDLVTFFLRAPMEFRAENIASRHNIDIKKAQKLVEEREAARKEYYDYYTGREWGDSKGYDLCIDVSKLGLEETAKMMIAFIDSVFGKKAEK
ncbi:MAG: cytidylate kinase-like family protein [Paludibacteraceae bacterium]|nr:cytidylate kinase-like family protein [Paludibacteraceae bacterium]